MPKPVILTGIRANGELHLGNYLGAMLPMVRLQKQYAGEYQLNMFVPDLHSFTTPVDHATLYDQTLNNLKLYVTSGLILDDENTYIYRQSYVAEHSELAVILNNFAYYGELQRMTQFKEKSDGIKATSLTAGLFDYPVLMAADILLYGSTWIPVGEDQRQHLELARDIALRVNNKFNSDVFIVPEAWDKQLAFSGHGKSIRIKSLRNPDKKMSKSVTDPAGTILLSDTPDVAADKIMGATTDSVGVINFDTTNQPGVSNLLQILALLVNQPIEDVISTWQGTHRYGDLKVTVANEVKAFMTEFHKKLSMVNEASLMRKLESSEYLMRDVAGQRLYKVQQAVGLRPL